MAGDRKAPVGSDPRHIDTVASVLKDVHWHTGFLEWVTDEERKRS